MWLYSNAHFYFFNLFLSRRPEITVVSARPLSEVIGFGKGAPSSSDSSAPARPVPSKRLSLNMDSKPGKMMLITISFVCMYIEEYQQLSRLNKSASEETHSLYISP